MNRKIWYVQDKNPQSTIGWVKKIACWYNLHDNVIWHTQLFFFFFIISNRPISIYYSVLCKIPHKEAHKPHKLVIPPALYWRLFFYAEF